MTTAPGYTPPDHNDIPITAKMIISAIDRTREQHTESGPNGSAYRPDEAGLLVLAADAIDTTVQEYVGYHVKSTVEDVVRRCEKGVGVALRAVDKIVTGRWSGVGESAGQWFGRAESDWTLASALRRQYGLGEMDPELTERLEKAKTAVRFYDLRPEGRRRAVSSAEALIEWLGRSYVECLVAVQNAAPDNDHDVNRWRGHMEAYRQTAERVAKAYDLPHELAAFSTGGWRSRHGVSDG